MFLKAGSLLFLQKLLSLFPPYNELQPIDDWLWVKELVKTLIFHYKLPLLSYQELILLICYCNEGLWKSSKQGNHAYVFPWTLRRNVGDSHPSCCSYNCFVFRRGVGDFLIKQSALGLFATKYNTRCDVSHGHLIFFSPIFSLHYFFFLN